MKVKISNKSKHRSPTKQIKLKHYCGSKYKPSTYIWEPRKPKPKMCPRCKTRLDGPIKK